MSRILRLLVLAVFVSLTTLDGNLRLDYDNSSFSRNMAGAMAFDKAEIEDGNNERPQEQPTFEEIEEPRLVGNRLANPEEVKAEIVRVFRPLGEEALGWASRVAACESSYSQFSFGGSLLENGSGCFGVFQFKRGTFEHYCSGDIELARDQIDCAASMWSRGLQDHWVCK